MFSEATCTSSGASLCAVVSIHDASPLTQAAVAQQAAWPPRIYPPSPRASDAGSNNSAISYTCSSSVYGASQYGCVSPSSTGSPGAAFMHTAPGSFTFRSASGCSASSYADCPSPPWAGSTCFPAGPYTGMDHGLGPAHVPMHAAQTECGGALVLYGANHMMVGGSSLLGLYYDERVHGPNAAKDAVNPFAPGLSPAGSLLAPRPKYDVDDPIKARFPNSSRASDDPFQWITTEVLDLGASMAERSAKRVPMKCLSARH